jgi:outer membrane protein assembly complex protein YaeT
VEDTGVQLSSLELDGVDRTHEQAVTRMLASKPKGRWPWSPRAPFDDKVFAQDLDRIRRYYQDRGFPDARIDEVRVEFNDARTRVDVSVSVIEGAPVVVDTVEFHGFEALGEAFDAVRDGTAVAAGLPRDRAAVATTRQQAAEFFRDHGYAYGAVEVVERTVAPGRVTVSFQGEAGPPTVFGPIVIDGLDQVSERVIRRQLSVRPGAPYRASELAQSQRRLTRLDILEFANVDARPPVEARPPAIPVRVTVAEDEPRRVQLGIGYGTEDRLRGSAEWSHLNLFGNAQRASVTGRWSAIDRGGEAAFAEPFFFWRGLSFEATGASWWTRERVYTSTTAGGRAGVAYRFGRRARGAGRPPGDVARLQYVHESLRYAVRPEVRADLTNVEQLIALGLDPITGQGRGVRAAVAASYQRLTTESVADPHSGYGLSLHGEIADPALGGTFRYREVRGEARVYVPIGSTVVAARTRAGVIAARADTDVPFSQRYFLGGASSLRGWGRYQVAPLTDGIPVGGRALLEATLEWRVPVRGRFGIVGFVDAGNVWARRLAATTGGLRADGGLGLRVATPIGLVRADAAQQLNPVPGLLVAGQPETRHWRVHVSIGHAF